MSSAGGTVRDQCGSDRVTEGMMVAGIFRRIMGTGAGVSESAEIRDALPVRICIMR